MPNDSNRSAEQFLTFVIAGVDFAIPILKVREIIQYDGLTRVPHIAQCIRGVINLRGGVVPVIDLGVKFGHRERPVSASTCIVIVESTNDGHRSVMGVLADAVSEVVALSLDDIEPPPDFGTSVKVEYLSGLGKLGDGFALILDSDRVLSHAELLAESSIEPAEAPRPALERQHASTAATA